MSYLEQVLADYDQTRPHHSHEKLTTIVVRPLGKRHGPKTETQREELKAELLTNKSRKVQDLPGLPLGVSYFQSSRLSCDLSATCSDRRGSCVGKYQARLHRHRRRLHRRLPQRSAYDAKAW